MRRTTKFAGVGIAIAALALTACAPTTATPDATTDGSEAPGAAESVAIDVGMITSSIA